MDNPQQKPAREGAMGPDQDPVIAAISKSLQEYADEIGLAIFAWEKDESLIAEARAAAQARCRQTIQSLGIIPDLPKYFLKIESFLREAIKEEEL